MALKKTKSVGRYFLNSIAANVLQLGAVCVGLWLGNCAKVLLAVWFLNFFERGN